MEFREPGTDIVSHRVLATPIPYPAHYRQTQPQVELHRRRQVNMGAYTLTATQAPELIPNNTFELPQPMMFPYSSPYDTLAPLQIREEELGTQIPIIDYPSDDEKIFFDFSTVNTSLKPPGIIIQPSEQE